MTFSQVKINGPSFLVILSALIGILGLLLKTPYTNIILATALLFLFFAWLYANLLKLTSIQNLNEKSKIKKTITAMSLCISLGVLMLGYYEYQIPKYNVARVKKELYRVPPQLSKKQLIELGRECNTYGNTLCSHDVFAKIVHLDPRDFTSLANLAMAQTHLGFHHFAVINFDRAIQKGTKTFDIFKFYGDSLLYLNKKELAIENYKKSLELKPSQLYLIKKIKSIEESLKSDI